MIARVLRVGLAGIFAAALLGGVGCKWVRGGDADEASSATAAVTVAPPPPGPATVAQDPVPEASAAPSAEAEAEADPPPNPADTGAPEPTRHGKEPILARGPVASIDACCSALAAYKFSGRPAGVRHKAVRAAGVCRSIADTVRSGRSTRAAGLAQVRALAGGAAPPECN